MRPGGHTVPIHYLRRNDTVWSPPSLICWDTEAYRTETPTGELQRLRCWVGALIDRRTSKSGKHEARSERGTTADELAQWFDGCMVGRDTVWAYAHNLSYDLTLTRLPDAMAKLGWSISDFSMDNRSAWLRLTKGRKHLTFCDSFTVIPKGLAEIGGMLGIGKLQLPDNDDSEEAWLARCEQDVRILCRAMLDLMAWWDHERLGKWCITGPSTGWHAMRHKMTPNKMTIDPDPDAVQWDRKAIHGGRRDGTKIGTWYERLFAVIDFEAAYPTLAKECPLPQRRAFRFESLPLDHPMIDHPRIGVIAEVEIETDIPRYPVRIGRRTVYPTGRFTTILCSPEIVWARESGHLVHIGMGCVYRLGRALTPWADWVLQVQAGKDDAHTPLAAVVAKHWGRACLGRFAAHGRRKEHLGMALTPGWTTTDGYSHASEANAMEVNIMGEHYWIVMDQETENSFPAVFAWVESLTRVRLGKMVEELGEEVWVSCDTDGCIVDVEALWRTRPEFDVSRVEEARMVGVCRHACDELAKLTWPLVPRVKQMVHNLEVHGPQHIIGPGVTKMSGISRKATRTSESTFEGLTWPGLPWQLSHGDMHGYVLPQRTWRLPGVALQRWITESGAAVPVQVDIDTAGVTQIIPWHLLVWPQLGVHLGPKQAHLLAVLR